MSRPDHVRLAANISRSQDNALRGYAARRGVSVKAATEHGIRLLGFVDKAGERGAAIKVREPDGRYREVLFLFL